jgi:hypothetical protein
MSRLSRDLVIGLVAVLLLLIIVVAVLDRTGDGVVATPSSSASRSASASPSATPSLAASPSQQQDPKAVFARIEQQVRDLRGLAAPDIGPADIISRQELEQELKASFEQDYPADRQRADNLTLHALGLLTGDQDVAKLQLELLSGQVIGFYDDRQRRMVVVSDSGVDPQVEVTYAHEYTHALQDAAFGLKSLELNAVGEDDRSLARLALVEGDATAVMLQWMLANLSPAEMQGITEAPIPDTSDVPDWMLTQLLFPYEAGFQFVSALGGGLGGDYQRVNDAFRDRPPASTEQVMHPEKYQANERPMQVADPDPGSALGAGWQNVASTTMGEAMIGITLDALGSTAATDAAASGWGGDRLTVASGPDDASALAWRLKWDTSTDADQFVAAYGSVTLSMAHRLLRVAPDEVLVLQASSPEVLDRVAAAR